VTPHRLGVGGKQPRDGTSTPITRSPARGTAGLAQGRDHMSVLPIAR
jgi:hypothetical protein